MSVLIAFVVGAVLGLLVGAVGAAISILGDTP
jgi:Na+/H+-dicarboxylate symporter